ncbi:hypothetical protein [Stutzerimonas stutzeri]|uniref:hypothetical protein n=1 Tax=Stutzerimonas stutzeri TaxID=316 RepID=UPI0015E2F8BD|nr:hypothetical protein [Stutzerimonas stutzeri]MBA1280265.1 hypothetical protein [Stutzerimonas stutzeri]
MRLARVFLNPDSDEPTQGLRGIACLAVGFAAPFFLDWKTMLVPLAIAVLGGIGLGIAMLGQAWLDSDSKVQS